jgi:hypothetical protein
MAWQTDMVVMLRFLINDVEAPQTYTDERLETLIAVAATYVLSEMKFHYEYVVNISTPSITPDPTDIPDLAFMNLVTLKAACLFDNWGYRSKMGTSGISVKSGADTVSTGGQLSGYQWILQNGACKGYETAKWEFEAGNLCPGRAILGPFAGWNVDTDYGGIAIRGRG